MAALPARSRGPQDASTPFHCARRERNGATRAESNGKLVLLLCVEVVTFAFRQRG